MVEKIDSFRESTAIVEFTPDGNDAMISTLMATRQHTIHLNNTANQTAQLAAIGLSPLGKLYTPMQRQQLLSTLINEVDWGDDFHMIYGRRFDIPRLQAWFADPGIRYSYSNNLLKTQSWMEPLLTIKQDIEAMTAQRFNAVLLTYYRNGLDHVGWHADDEEELGEAPVIASFSLGEKRQFHFRHKTDRISDSLLLEDGDLLLMHPNFQQQWQHCAPAEKVICKPRINLTFRLVVANPQAPRTKV